MPPTWRGNVTGLLPACPFFTSAVQEIGGHLVKVETGRADFHIILAAGFRLGPTEPMKLDLTFIVALLSSAVLGTPAAEPPPKPLFPGLAPACACEGLTNVALPNTTIE